MALRPDTARCTGSAGSTTLTITGLDLSQITVESTINIGSSGKRVGSAYFINVVTPVGATGGTLTLAAPLEAAVASEPFVITTSDGILTPAVATANALSRLLTTLYSRFGFDASTGTDDGVLVANKRTPGSRAEFLLQSGGTTYGRWRLRAGDSDQQVAVFEASADGSSFYEMRFLRFDNLSPPLTVEERALIHQKIGLSNVAPDPSAAASAEFAEEKAIAAAASAVVAGNHAASAGSSAAYATNVAAVTAAAASEAIVADVRSQLEQISAGLSGAGGLAYLLDGVDASRIGALCSIPRGLFALNGAIVPITSILNFSTGPKYTTGPDGKLALTTANGPAYDWSGGRRRLLIEPASTNYWTNSENPAAWPGANAETANTVDPVGLGVCALSRFEAQAGISPGATLAWLNGPSATVGQKYSLTVSLKKGSSPQSPRLGIFCSADGWGANSDSIASIISGPGVVAQNIGGIHTVSGLSETEVTRVRITRTIAVAGQVMAGVYFGNSYAITPGWTLYAGAPQFEAGTGSSYIPTGGTATARPADVVSVSPALLALLTAANATIALRGDLVNVPASPSPILATTTAGRFGALCRDQSAANKAVYASGGGSLIAAVDAPSTRVALCAGLSSAPQIKLASAGGVLVSSAAGPVFAAADTAIALGSGASLTPAAMLIDEMVVWPFLGSTAGISAQAKIYS